MIREIPPLQKQLIKFSLIGGLAVIVDFITYYSLLNILPDSILPHIKTEAVAKALSFICGMMVTYTLNKYWTWKQKNRSRKRLIKFAFLYGTSLIINVIINSVLLYILFNNSMFANLPHKHFAAFAGATASSAATNFLGQKFWVFKSTA